MGGTPGVIHVSGRWSLTFCFMILFYLFWWFAQVLWADSFVVTGRAVLGVVVCLVCGSWFPVDFKLLLSTAVTNPVIPHVYGLGFSLFDGVVRKTLGTGIVCDQWCSWLWVAHLHKGCANGGSILLIVKSPCYFDLCCTCYYCP